jgi:hypothetical protein
MLENKTQIEIKKLDGLLKVLSRCFESSFVLFPAENDFVQVAAINYIEIIQRLFGNRAPLNVIFN